MKICDRCESKPVVETIIKSKTKEEIDLCQKCLDEFEEFRKSIERGKVGRPRKDGTN